MRIINTSRLILNGKEYTELTQPPEVTAVNKPRAVTLGLEVTGIAAADMVFQHAALVRKAYAYRPTEGSMGIDSILVEIPSITSTTHWYLVVTHYSSSVSYCIGYVGYTQTGTTFARPHLHVTLPHTFVLPLGWSISVQCNAAAGIAASGIKVRYYVTPDTDNGIPFLVPNNVNTTTAYNSQQLITSAYPFAAYDTYIQAAYFASGYGIATLHPDCASDFSSFGFISQPHIASGNTTVYGFPIPAFKQLYVGNGIRYAYCNMELKPLFLPSNFGSLATTVKYSLWGTLPYMVFMGRYVY